MGILDNITHKSYYEGSDFGSYQFTSLNHVISQFEIAYVGENKIISKIKRVDVAFHAQRALQEFSFDTFKSIKSQQIDLPPSLVMTLPHDYVNYSKLSWVDSAGIKHLLYPTNKTSNPFQIRVDDDFTYSFPEEKELIIGGGFDAADAVNGKPGPPFIRNQVPNHAGHNYGNFGASDVLSFNHRTRHSHGKTNWGHALGVWQEIDVSQLDYLDIKADGSAVDVSNSTGVLRFGISSKPGDSNSNNIISSSFPQSTNALTSSYDLKTNDGFDSYLEWSSADGTAFEKELLQINVTSYDKVYALVVSFQNYSGTNDTLQKTSSIDNLSVRDSGASKYLSRAIDHEFNSTTWNKYKANTPSENQDDYQDDTYWPMDGNRYGLDPQHAQANGSFYIDQLLGRIHFSSNVSGKTVILDYISDSVGTDDEMQVHKFAEEAMYKWIAYAILSTSSSQIHQQLAPRFKKERFAAVRTAKLRLSSIKLEELTQVLRGKSKQIKH